MANIPLQLNITLENWQIFGDIYFPKDKEMSYALVSLQKKCFYFNRKYMNLFCDLFLGDFENAAFAHFTKFPIEDRLQQPFINSLVPIWNTLLEENLFSQAQIFWHEILQMIERIESHFNKEIHKGAIYYYYGISAIKNGELELGYRSMGSALVEDKKTYHVDQPDTPVYKFIHFDYNAEEQKTLAYVQELKRCFLGFLPGYQKLHSSSLDEMVIQDQFIRKHPNEEAVFLLNYTIARINYYSKHPKDSPDNLFAGILDLNLLFDLIRVISISINKKLPVPEKDFYGQANKLGDEAFKLKWHKNLLDELSKKYKEGERDKTKEGLYNIINNLLLRKSSGRKNKDLLPLEQDIGIAYLLRNHSAHNIDPNLTLPINRYGLMQSIFNVLFLVIDTFYI